MPPLLRSRLAIASTILIVSAGSASALVALGAGTASARPAQQSPEVQHYLCYTATAKGFKAPSGVRLVNVFAPNGFVPKIGAADLHCNPAEKIVPTGTFPITDPTLHYLCFKLTAKQSSNTAVLTNQFGTAALSTGSPNNLCLPSWKSLTGPPNQSPNQPSANHYTCYPAKYVAGAGTFTPPASVAVSDEFSPAAAVQVKVGAPQSLCVPTEKILSSSVSYPMTDPNLFFVCFAVSKTPVVKTVFDENQFGQGSVTIKKTKQLCVPSTLSTGPAG